ncbi:hypothetical protein [Streptomyces sp. CBG33]|uniref:hypothetical protein n=1 Tax=Streptomyces sp. CBG33 TaxID=2762624 RepID=UPI0021BD3843|nr:hypothetical protein [Streptomyces sp. CBG33]
MTLAVVVGALLGLAAASARSRWLDDLLMRPVELLLPLPSLLVISVVGVGWRGHPVATASRHRDWMAAPADPDHADHQQRRQRQQQFHRPHQ